MNVYDVIGVGFGPSNIAMAIALQEQYHHADVQAKALFLEKKAQFAWHPDMLLNNANMQISFLKDLATPRNPQSKYSFLNYLHEHDRLQDFINLKTFFPSRYEFNDYLTWLANNFTDQCHYDSEVISVEPYFGEHSQVELLKVITQSSTGDTQHYLTKSIVISAGGYGNIPQSFADLKDDQRVFHSSQYLSRIQAQNNPQRIAVIGAGQSAAEIFLDLHNRQDAGVDMIMRSLTFKPSDSSPFVNEIFNPDFTDYIYHTSQDRRQQLLTEYKSTNYSAPDLEIINQIYDVFYRQKISKQQRHTLYRRHEILDVTAKEDGVALTIREMDTGEVSHILYDAVVLATGYIRNTHERLLAPVKQYINQADDFEVDRNYQIKTDNTTFKPAIFLQGACEDSHGLSDTLLSILATRSAEICQQIDTKVMNRSINLA